MDETKLRTITQLQEFLDAIPLLESAVASAGSVARRVRAG